MARLPLGFWLFRTLVDIVTFLFADITLNVTQVLDLILIFFCNLGSINPYSWVTLTASFMAFVILGAQKLWLTYINSREIVELSLVSIAILLIGFVLVILGRFVAFWALGIDFPYF